MLALASTAKRAVLTINRKHFIRLHRQSDDHAGIVVCKFDPDFKGQAERIHLASESLSEMTGQLIRVNRPTN